MKPNFIYLTLFPQYFQNYFQISLAKKINERKLFTYRIYDLRDFAPKRQVDDYPYGGGGGMVLKIEPLVRALAAIQKDYPNSYLILLSPQGKNFTQGDVPRLLNQAPNLVFICGHYEGFDERIWYYIDEQISVGEYITMGGEIPALVLTDALIRAIPGAIQVASYQQESFTNASENQTDYLLDFATYTRPEEYQGLKVPGVLLSGNHQKIKEWRKKNSQEKTQQKSQKYKNNNKIIYMPVERTLSIIKPDVKDLNSVWEIIKILEKKGLKVVRMKITQLTLSQAEIFYQEHQKREFFLSLIKFMCSGPVVIMCLEGENAIKVNREIMGATNPQEAKPGTIRKIYGKNIETNAIHGSDSPQAAEREIKFFNEIFLLNW